MTILPYKIRYLKDKILEHSSTNINQCNTDKKVLIVNSNAKNGKMKKMKKRIKNRKKNC